MLRIGFELPNACDTCSRNLYQKFARVSVNLVSLLVFFWYKFLAHNRTQLYSSTETVWHVTRNVQRDWPASCCFARNWWTCVKFFVQVSGASFLSESLLVAFRVREKTANDTCGVFDIRRQTRLLRTCSERAADPSDSENLCSGERVDVTRATLSLGWNSPHHSSSISGTEWSLALLQRPETELDTQQLQQVPLIIVFTSATR